MTRSLGKPLPPTSAERTPSKVIEMLKEHVRRSEWKLLDNVLDSRISFYILGFPERIGGVKDCVMDKKDNVPHEFTILWDKHTYN